MHLPNCLSTFPIKCKPVLSNGPKVPPRSPSTILDGWFFENFIVVDEPFAKTLRILETCVSVINNLCRELFSSWESLIIYDKRFRVALVPFSIPDFDLLIVNETNLHLMWYILSHFIVILY